MKWFFIKLPWWPTFVFIWTCIYLHLHLNLCYLQLNLYSPINWGKEEEARPVDAIVTVGQQSATWKIIENNNHHNHNNNHNNNNQNNHRLSQWDNNLQPGQLLKTNTGTTLTLYGHPFAKTTSIIRLSNTNSTWIHSNARLESVCHSLPERNSQDAASDAQRL